MFDRIIGKAAREGSSSSSAAGPHDSGGVVRKGQGRGGPERSREHGSGNGSGGGGVARGNDVDDARGEAENALLLSVASWMPEQRAAAVEAATATATAQTTAASGRDRPAAAVAAVVAAVTPGRGARPSRDVSGGPSPSLGGDRSGSNDAGGAQPRGYRGALPRGVAQRFDDGNDVRGGRGGGRTPELRRTGGSDALPPTRQGGGGAGRGSRDAAPGVFFYRRSSSNESCHQTNGEGCSRDEGASGARENSAETIVPEYHRPRCDQPV